MHRSLNFSNLRQYQIPAPHKSSVKVLSQIQMQCLPRVVKNMKSNVQQNSTQRLETTYLWLLFPHCITGTQKTA